MEIINPKNCLIRKTILTKILTKEINIISIIIVIKTALIKFSQKLKYKIVTKHKNISVYFMPT